MISEVSHKTRHVLVQLLANRIFLFANWLEYNIEILSLFDLLAGILYGIMPLSTYTTTLHAQEDSRRPSAPLSSGHANPCSNAPCLAYSPS